MGKTLEARIGLRRVPLARASLGALRHLERYDLVVFTSKNAKRFFMRELRERRIEPPAAARVTIVGPRADLLKLDVHTKRVLFPRSAAAPFDIVRQMRARGAVVRIVPLYTAQGARLRKSEKEALAQGEITRLSFRSPSGVAGLLVQLRGALRQKVLALPARCIGETTAQAARRAGFKKVFVAGIL